MLLNVQWISEETWGSTKVYRDKPTLKHSLSIPMRSSKSNDKRAPRIALNAHLYGEVVSNKQLNSRKQKRKRKKTFKSSISKGKIAKNKDERNISKQ